MRTLLAKDIVSAHLKQVLRESWRRTRSARHEFGLVRKEIRYLRAVGNRIILWQIQVVLIAYHKEKQRSGNEKHVTSGLHDSSSSHKERRSHIEQEIDRLVGIVEAGMQGVHNLLTGESQSQTHYLVDVGLRDFQIRGYIRSTKGRSRPCWGTRPRRR
jgi:hypothetical protein